MGSLGIAVVKLQIWGCERAADEAWRNPCCNPEWRMPKSVYGSAFWSADWAST
jgi:hypothetical protein